MTLTDSGLPVVSCEVCRSWGASVKQDKSIYPSRRRSALSELNLGRQTIFGRPWRADKATLRYQSK